MRNALFIALLIISMTSCSEQRAKQNVLADAGFARVPEWATGIVWYQVFPERFRNGDPGNDPALVDQKGCWPHELKEPWEPHPWHSDWYAMQDYEKATGEDLGYNITRRRYGGDLQGLIDKLDYLQELGVDALYLNPVFMAPSHHKYDIASYHHIDPNFGPDPEGDRALMATEVPDDPATWKWTSADKLALKLIDEVHARGMRVIFDGVFNHVGYNHFAIADVREKQQASRFRDWFTIHSWEDEEQETSFEYQGWWGIQDMPELREDTNGIVEGPKKYIFDITRRWMDPYGDGELSRGIDGWRLDVAYEVGHPFWKDWRRHVRSINPGAYLVAEVIESPENLKPFLQGDEFDAVMNYNFQFICSEFFINKGINAVTFGEKLDSLRNAFSADISLAMQNLLGSHDTDRPLSRVKNKGIASFLEWQDYFDIGKAKNHDYKTSKPSPEDKKLFRLMVAFQMCYPGSPMIYYGDEAGMWGAGDPDCRKPMLWEDIPFDDEHTDANGKAYEQASKVHPDQELIAWYQELIAIRRAHPALKTGDYRCLLAGENGGFAFKRQEGEDIVVAFFNNTEAQNTLNIPSIPPGKYLDELCGANYESRDGTLEIILPAHEAAILHLIRE